MGCECGWEGLAPGVEHHCPRCGPGGDVALLLYADPGGERPSVGEFTLWIDAEFPSCEGPPLAPPSSGALVYRLARAAPASFPFAALPIGTPERVADRQRVLARVGALFEGLAEQGVEPLGPPFMAEVKHGDSQRSPGPVCGVRTRPLSGPLGAIMVGTLEVTDAFETLHRGPHDLLHLAHSALTAYLDFRELNALGRPIEFYLSSPFEHPPWELQTGIIQPVCVGEL